MKLSRAIDLFISDYRAEGRINSRNTFILELDDGRVIELDRRELLDRAA